VRAKILPLFFGELEAGKAKTLEAKIKQKKRGTFLKTNELSIEGENHARPVSSLSPPQRALRGGLPQQDAEAKTTVDSTTQHAQNSHNSLPTRLSNLF
jgi:hypothetical protein